MASPHLPHRPPSSALPPASRTASLTTNGSVPPCLGSQALQLTRGMMVPGLEACGNMRPQSEWGLGTPLGDYGKDRELPPAQVPQEEGENPGPSSWAICLPACLWRSMQQSLFPQVRPQPCPQTQSITVWSNSKPN